MYERGTVAAVDNNFVSITCGNADHCKTCAAGKLLCNVKAREFKALNTDNLDLKTGDIVEIYISPGKTIGYSFSILIFPLLVFLAGYFLTGKLTNTLSDGIKVLGGTIGLFVGFGIAFLYNFFTKKNQFPVITKKIDDES